MYLGSSVSSSHVLGRRRFPTKGQLCGLLGIVGQSTWPRSVGNPVVLSGECPALGGALPCPLLFGPPVFAISPSALASSSTVLNPFMISSLFFVFCVVTSPHIVETRLPNLSVTPLNPSLRRFSLPSILSDCLSSATFIVPTSGTIRSWVLPIFANFACTSATSHSEPVGRSCLPLVGMWSVSRLTY